MKRSLLLVLTGLLAGCVSMRDATVSLIYTPASLAETPFNLRPGTFSRVTPAGIAPNQYETSGYAFGKQISLSEPIADYLKTAIVQELRRAGASLRDTPACTIGADISSMTLAYSGASKLTFSGKLTYTVTAEGGRSVQVSVEPVQETQVNSAEAGHSQFVTKTIDALLTSPAFAAFARANCPRTGG
jgi:hypothetical protein